MTLEEFIGDVRTVLRQTTDDSSFSDLFILSKGLNYRSIFIPQQFLSTGEISPDWLMRLGNKRLTPVSSADNPNIPDGSIKVGKLKFPSAIPVGHNLGVEMVMNTQRQKQIYRTSWPILMHMIQAKDNRLELFSYYCTIADNLYVYPFIDQIDISIIPENPLDCIELETEFINVDGLVIGTEYFILSGSVTKTIDNVQTTYKKNEEFICEQDAEYNFYGKVIKSERIKLVSATTRFPADRGMCQRIILEMLTKDFNIEIKNIPDVTNDSIDERKLNYKR